MKQHFEALLTGTDTLVEGMANKINNPEYDNVLEFESVDNDVHLVIAKDKNDKWIRLGGTVPYLSSWVEELAKQARKLHSF